MTYLESLLPKQHYISMKILCFKKTGINGFYFQTASVWRIAYSANMSRKHLDCRKHGLGLQCQHYFDTQIAAKHIGI